MQRKPIQPPPRLRVLAVAAATAIAIACAETTAPRDPAALGLDANKRDDSSACNLTVSGTVWRFAAIDTTRDTLGRRDPLPGARVELYFVAPLPPDTVPRDSVPRDSVPRDSVPRDSVPRDSVPRDSVPNDTMLYARAALGSVAASGVSAAAADSGRGGRPSQPDAKGTTRGDGTYSIRGVCPGVYRVDVHEPGTNRTVTQWVIIRYDTPYLNFGFPPKR